MKLINKRFLILVGICCCTLLQATAQCDSGNFRQGVTYYQQNQFRQAIEAYSRQIKACPFKNVYLDRAFSYTNLGIADSALSDYNSAIQFVPDSNKPSTYLTWSDIVFNTRSHYDIAFELYKKTVALVPDASIAWYRMARCKWLQRLHVLQENRVDDYKTDPVLNAGLKDEILRYFAKAIYLDSVKNFEEYKQQTELASIRNMNTNYSFYADRAIVEMDFDDLAGALKDMETANWIHPTIANYRIAAYLAKALGEKDKACTYIQKWAMFIDPRHPEEIEKTREEANKFCNDLGVTPKKTAEEMSKELEDINH